MNWFTGTTIFTLPYPLLLSFAPLDDDHTLRILLYSLIFFLSVFGNLLIIVVLTVNKRMRTVTNTFLLSLAVSDLMMAVFCMPFTLIPSILKDFIFGAAMCKIVSYLMGERWEGGEGRRGKLENVKNEGEGRKIIKFGDENQWLELRFPSLR